MVHGSISASNVAKELQTSGLPVGEKPHHPTVISVNALPTCDGWSDILPVAMLCSSIAEHDKNVTI